MKQAALGANEAAEAGALEAPVVLGAMATAEPAAAGLPRIRGIFLPVAVVASARASLEAHQQRMPSSKK
jgi:hypothetical protein